MQTELSRDNHQIWQQHQAEIPAMVRERNRDVKAWLIQPAIAPYRVPLFQEIGSTPGIDLTVVVQAETLAGHPWKIDINQLPFQVLRVPAMRWQRNFESEAFISPAIIREFIRHRPDVVICSGFTMSTMLLFLPMLLFGTPFIIWNEGTCSTDGNISPIKLRIRRALARRASGFLVAGSLSRQYIEGLLPRPENGLFHLAYNCIDNAHFMRDMSNEDDRAHLNQLKQRFAPRNLLHVGKLGERKGIKQLLEAYRRLVHDRGMQDVGLILLGDGPLRQYICDFAEQHKLDKIHVGGFVPQDQIPAYYALADVFVLLSIADPNPLVIFEALATGLPIVCSSRAGNAVDFIVNGSNGYQVDPLDTDAVVDKMALALTTIDRTTSTCVSRKLVMKATYQDVAKVFADAVIIAGRAGGQSLGSSVSG
ncbi:MAG: glycosyltransferase family 4 protein [Nitrospira sp.]|nr:MAG: glycosyltransferase family 4 protein [Nitrospira sp.]